MSQTDQTAENVYSLKIADAAASLRHVFVRDLQLDAEIGAYDREKGIKQPVVINIDLTVAEVIGEGVDLDDELSNVVCYDDIVQKVKNLLSTGHINLVETMAERIAQECLQDARVKVARIRVEKTHAISQAKSVGVEIERRQS